MTQTAPGNYALGCMDDGTFCAYDEECRKHDDFGGHRGLAIEAPPNRASSSLDEEHP